MSELKLMAFLGDINAETFKITLTVSIFSHSGAQMGTSGNNTQQIYKKYV
jgi:hypothetical protein